MNAPLGYAARPLTQDDAPAIADLINLFERIYVEDPDTVGAAEVAGWWSSSDLATDSVAFLAADGALASIGVIYPRRRGARPGRLGPARSPGARARFDAGRVARG